MEIFCCICGHHYIHCQTIACEMHDIVLLLWRHWPLMYSKCPTVTYTSSDMTACHTLDSCVFSHMHMHHCHLVQQVLTINSVSHSTVYTGNAYGQHSKIVIKLVRFLLIGHGQLDLSTWCSLTHQTTLCTIPPPPPPDLLWTSGEWRLPNRNISQLAIQLAI